MDLRDINDTVNGCAGLIGHPIDGVQLYYTTQDGKTLSQAWYRAQTARGGGSTRCATTAPATGGDDYTPVFNDKIRTWVYVLGLIVSVVGLGFMCFGHPEIDGFISTAA